MPPRTWKAGDHEVAETVVRRQYRPREELKLEDAPGGGSGWIVLSVDQDPHGWRVTAARCLPGCRDHRGTRVGR